MHASDARHAMTVDPKRWTLAGDYPPGSKAAIVRAIIQGRAA
jgi:hypothetical protein